MSLIDAPATLPRNGGGVLRFGAGPVIIHGMLPPFTAPLSTEWQTDPFAWRGGKHRRPSWETRWLCPSDPYELDTAGVHALLRAACLPRAELLHMGALEADLAPDAPLWLPRERVVPLLGRVAMDHGFGLHGGEWIGSGGQAHTARVHGGVVVAEWFHA